MKLEELGKYYESILDREVRREQGIYYTPPLIVDYMVESTLGELLKNKTPDDAARIKIVDPSCGAGVFLLGAYQFLLDWHEKHFGNLTLKQRYKILTDNIFGVDIDPLAVEITKYCLSMKCSDGKDFSLDINQNIYCGNSLIGFDWQQTFPHIFKQGGFDIVIGNPPYGAKYSAEQKDYFLKHYESAKTTSIEKDGMILGKQKGSLDTFSLFIENGFNRLRKNGVVNFIVSIAFTSSDSMSALHKLLFQNCGKIVVSSYMDRPIQIFKNAHTPVSILLFTKTESPCTELWTTKRNRRKEKETLEDIIKWLEFVNCLDYTLRGRLPRIGKEIEISILEKLFSQNNTPIADIIQSKGLPVYYRTGGGDYFKIFTDYATGSTQEKPLYFDKSIANVIAAFLSSNLFWWFQNIYADGRHIKRYEIEQFQIPLTDLTYAVKRKIQKLYVAYLADIEKHVNKRIPGKQSSYKVDSFKEYKLVYSKALIDAIDDIICPLYGLTKDETEFIKNYELEFRMRGNK